MSETFDVYTHPLGKQLEESVAEAVKSFRKRHGCEPAAVWLNPALMPEGKRLGGLRIVRSKNMNPWYVYLELPAGHKNDDEAIWRQPMLLPF